jgi:hypothetical protein
MIAFMADATEHITAPSGPPAKPPTIEVQNGFRKHPYSIVTATRLRRSLLTLSPLIVGIENASVFLKPFLSSNEIAFPIHGLPE